jgi:hypothetical protein
MRLVMVVFRSPTGGLTDLPMDNEADIPLLTALATRFPGPIREGTLLALEDEEMFMISRRSLPVWSMPPFALRGARVEAIQSTDRRFLSPSLQYQNMACA